MYVKVINVISPLISFFPLELLVPMIFITFLWRYHTFHGHPQHYHILETSDDLTLSSQCLLAPLDLSFGLTEAVLRT